MHAVHVACWDGLCIMRFFVTDFIGVVSSITDHFREPLVSMPGSATFVMVWGACVRVCVCRLLNDVRCSYPAFLPSLFLSSSFLLSPVRCSLFLFVSPSSSSFLPSFLPGFFPSFLAFLLPSSFFLSLSSPFPSLSLPSSPSLFSHLPSPF